MESPMRLELRPITADEHAEFHRVSNQGFGAQPTPEGVDDEADVLEVDRTVAAFDGDVIAGTAMAYSKRLTVPGGATVPVAAVSNVTVQTTHRRRGVLRAMMAHQLEDVARRGEPMAVLNASEGGIYGRFGYGAAQWSQSWSIARHEARFARAVPVPAGAGPVRIIPRDAALAALPAIYDRVRAARPGMLTQSSAWWSLVLGDRRTWKGGGDVFVAVAEPAADGTGGGYAIYELDLTGRPGRLVVRELHGTDPVGEARLWALVLDVDLVHVVEADARPVDDPLRWWLSDPRSVATVRVQDYLWVRVLDVVAALEARRYPVAGSVVLDVRDGVRPSSAGRFRLEAGADGGASCAPTEAAADLSLDVADLGAVYLGGVSLRTLAAAGRIDELVAGAVDAAAALFAWPVAPFCVTRF